MLTYVSTPDEIYHDAVQRVLDEGVEKTDRTGVGTMAVFGHSMRFNLRPTGPGFPVLTTKAVGWKSAMREMLWMLSGSESILPLLHQGISIWTAWPLRNWAQQNRSEVWETLTLKGHVDTTLDAYKELQREFEAGLLSGDIAPRWAELGPVYGSQWRRWHTGPRGMGGEVIDQIVKMVETLRSNPDDRRNIVTAWNVAELEAMAVSGLPPCHYVFQVGTVELTREQRQGRALAQWLLEREDRKYDVDSGRVTDGGVHRSAMATQLLLTALGSGYPERELSLHMTIRSNDAFLGAPFNVAQYAFLTCLIAHHVGMAPGDLYYVATDFHLYRNHLDQTREQLARATGVSPRFRVTGPRRADLAEYTLDDVALVGYDPQGAIKAPVAV